MDAYVVAIMKGSEIIGQVPCKISAACYLFIQKSGILTCFITDSNHQYSSDLPQGRFQIPYKLVFVSHDVELMVKVRKFLQSAPQIYVQLEQPASKQKLELSYKAKTEPVKKKERKDDSQAIDLDNKDVSQTTVAVACAAAKEIPWVKFGRCLLTTVDKRHHCKR